MRKLDDIPKKAPFTIPEGYFDQLPTTIQARMSKEGRRSPVRGIAMFSLRYALPVIALIVAGIFWFRPEGPVLDELEEIDTQQIALYLATTDRVDLEDNHEVMDWTEFELNALEDSVLSNMDYTKDNLDNILEDIDLDNL